MNIAVNAWQKTHATRPMPCRSTASIRRNADRVPERHDLAVLRAPAPRGSGALHAGQRLSARTGRSPSGTTSWRWTPTMQVFSSADGIVLATLESIIENEKIRGPRDRNAGGFISMDPPDHGVQAQDGHARRSRRPIWSAWPRQVRERAGHHPGPASDRRGVRLGRQGVEGTDGDDAGDAVRLPVRGPPQADLLVRHVHQCAGPRPRRRAGSTRRKRPTSASAPSHDLWNQRVNAEPGFDLISMLAHSPATRNMEPREYQGNVVLLIIGGNDTTRNTITGSVYALNKYPEQYDKLRANPESDHLDGVGDDPLADAAGAHAPHRAAGLRDRRQDDQEGRQGGRCGTSRATATKT